MIIDVSGPSVTHFDSNAGDIRLQLATDPPGRVETPARDMPRVSMHLGRSVYMSCHRAGLKHRGLAVHGDLDIVPAHTSCLWEPEGPDTALMVSLHPELLSRTAHELGVDTERLKILNRFQMRDHQLEQICWALKSEIEAGCPTGRLFLDSLSEALAAGLIQRHSSCANAPFPVWTSMSGRRLRQALGFIEDHLGQGLSLADIAAAVGLSVSHFKTTFREMTGMPVHQYVIKRRVERASELLSRGGLTISEVAVATGFANQSHLAKHMRRILGHSPKSLLASNRIGR